MAATFVAVLSMMWAGAPASAAVKCGDRGADGNTVAGELEVQDRSMPNLDFGAGTEGDSFILYLKVTGCSLTTTNGIDADLRVSKTAMDALGAVDLKAQGSLLTVEIQVDPDKFPTKLYKPVLTVSSTSEVIATTQVALTMQRKQPPGIPGVLAVLAFVAGFLWALHLARTTIVDKLEPGQRIEFKKRHGISAFVGAVIGAVPVFASIYITPDTWTLHLGTGLALVVGVASAAAGGATVGAGAAYAVSKAKKANSKAKQAKQAEEAEEADKAEKPTG